MNVLGGREGGVGGRGGREGGNGGRWEGGWEWREVGGREGGGRGGEGRGRVQNTWQPLVPERLFCLWDKCEFMLTCPKGK